MMQRDPLLGRALGWRLVGLLFERPRPGWHAEVRALTSEVDDDRSKSVELAARDADEGGYLSVFGPGGAVSPREVAYRRMGDPGKILAQLEGVYDAFGYHPKTEDPPDHIAVEAGFVGYMKLKQAYAVAQADAEGERTTRDTIATFMEDHLSSFAGDLAQRLDGTSQPHLEQAAAILKDWCPPVAPARASLATIQPVAAPDSEDYPTCGKPHAD
jgi:hypothetical protein